MWQGMRCLDTVAGSRTAEVTATGRVAMGQGMGHSLPRRCETDEPTTCAPTLLSARSVDPVPLRYVGVPLPLGWSGGDSGRRKSPGI